MAGRELIIADTSAWIEFIRDPNSPTGQLMVSLIAGGEVAMIGPVLAELLQGSRNEGDLEFLSSNLAGLEFLETDQQVWNLAGRINFNLRRQGYQMAFADLIIAATSIRHDIPLFTNDSGFSRIPKLRLHEPQ